MLLNEVDECGRNEELHALLRMLEYVSLRSEQIGAPELTQTLIKSKTAARSELQRGQYLL